MSKEKQILQMLQDGYSQRRIASTLCVSRNTVAKVHTATFCGQQGRIFRTVRAILNGQPGRSAGQRVVRPTDQYCSLFQQKAMLSQSVQ